MTRRRTSSEYQPSPPIVRLPGRGRMAQGLAGGVKEAVDQLFQTQEALSADEWKLAFRVSGTAAPTEFEDEVAVIPASGDVNAVSLTFTGAWNSSPEGFATSVAADNVAFITTPVINAIPGYVLGTPLRIVLELNSVTGLGDAVDGSFVGVAYQAVGEGMGLVSSQNGVQGPALQKFFAGISPATGNNEVRGGAVNIDAPNSVLALYFAFPSQQAYAGDNPIEGVLNWTSDVSPVGDLYCIDGDGMLPGGEGSAFNASTDAITIAVVNQELSEGPIVCSVKALSLYYLPTAFPEFP
jgi:hypothetical protein